MIEKAILFATKAHSGQKRKGSDIPYILHPLEAGVIAAGILNSLGQSHDELVCAAILHDTMEDAKVGYRTLEETFSKEVADLVKSQSEDKSKSWKDRKQHTLTDLAGETRQEVKILALCDKLSNIRALCADQQRVGEALWQRFNEKNKSEHAWYYKGLAEALKDLAQLKAYQEYSSLVQTVFED